MADQPFEPFLQGEAGRTRQQDQEIDVGCRVELAAAVAADCRQREGFRKAEAVPQAHEDVVDLVAARDEQRARIAVLRVGRAQAVAGGADFVAQRRDIDLDQAIHSGLGRHPADIVSTS